jgi:hypothetical protein
MYPAEILALFPPFPREDKIFVAMSFDPRFDARWKDVLKPSIEGIEWRSRWLQAHRVDLTRKSDSIITEIVREIAQCRLVLADLTTIGHLDGMSPRPIRNGNVLYEVGLAHASRLPQEVILLRSDHDVLDFDIAGVRVHRYDPGDINNARTEVQRLIRDALESVDLHKSIAVQQGLQSLDFTMYALLQESIIEIPHPTVRTFGELLAGTERLNAIYRLLSAAMFRAVFKPLTPELMAGAIPVEGAVVYQSTEFGRTVFHAAREQQGFLEAFGAWIKTPQGEAWLKAVVDARQQPPTSSDSAV